MMKFARLSLIATLAMLLMLSGIAQAQESRRSTPVQCGDIVESETNPNEGMQDFQIMAPAGTTLNGRVEPLGSTLNPHLWFLDTGGGEFSAINSADIGQPEEFIDFVIASSNPILRITGIQPGRVGAWEGYSRDFNNGVFRYYGAYTIYLGCVLRDGTVIEPGMEAPAPSVESQVTNFSGFGFPGLAPVDFSAAFRLPLTLGTPSAGEIPPAGDAVLGFRFEANAGDVLNLDFERTSGNLNLGLVVLSADNQVAYAAALVSTQTMNAAFPLPSSGEYTIGVFRIDLIPPSSPEPTAFTVIAQVGS